VGAIVALVGVALAAWGLVLPWAYRGPDYNTRTGILLDPAAETGPLSQLLGPVPGAHDLVGVVLIVAVSLGLISLLIGVVLAAGRALIGDKLGRLGGWAVGLTGAGLLAAPVYLVVMLLDLSTPICIRDCTSVRPYALPGYWVTLGGLLLALAGCLIMVVAEHAAGTSAGRGGVGLQDYIPVLIVALLIALGCSLLSGLPVSMTAGAGAQVASTPTVYSTPTATPTPFPSPTPAPTPTPHGQVCRASPQGASELGPEDWPQAGYDPEGAAYNPFEQTLNAHDVGQLCVAWYASGAFGIRAPVVATGQVYALERGTSTSLNDFDLHTGALKWSSPVPPSAGADPLDLAVEASRVFVVGSHTLAAFEATTGTIDWLYTANDIITSAPLVFSDMVYVAVRDGHVLAFNAITGVLRWSVTLAAPVTVPWLRAELSNQSVTVLYVGSGTTINSYEATAGGLIASRTVQLASNGARAFTPEAVAQGTVYGYGSDARFYAVDAATGKPRWSFATSGEIAAPPVLAYGMVYLAANDGKVYALDAASGALRWASPVNSGDVFTGGPIVGNGVVYVASTCECEQNDPRPHLFALSVGTGGTLGRWSLGVPLGASPVVVEGTLVVATVDGVYALRAGG
jgi:outer membrane protein assembly factor BamB